MVFVFVLLLDMLAVGSRETEAYPKFSLIKSDYKSSEVEFDVPLSIPCYEQIPQSTHLFQYHLLCFLSLGLHLLLSIMSVWIRGLAL